MIPPSCKASIILKCFLISSIDAVSQSEDMKTSLNLIPPQRRTLMGEMILCHEIFLHIDTDTSSLMQSNIYYYNQMIGKRLFSILIPPLLIGKKVNLISILTSQFHLVIE